MDRGHVCPGAAHRPGRSVYEKTGGSGAAGGGGNGRHLLSGSAVYGFGDRASCRDQFVQYAGGRSPWFAGDWAFVRGSGD